MPGLAMWSRGAFLWIPLPASHSRGPSSPSKDGALTPLPPIPTQRIVPMLPSLVISLSEYVVRNTASDSARHVAAWEIVRLPPGAIQFFPKGQELIGVSNTLRSDREDSIVWVADDGQRDGKLLYRDGREGWMAAVVDSLLLVKTWTDIPLGKIPPGQGEIQVYLQKNPAFAEMECMGPWTAVVPRDSTVWTVRWKVAPIPSQVSRTLGNPQLVRLARNLASAPVTSTSRRDRPRKRDGGVRMDASGRLVSRPDVSSPVEPRRTFSAP